MAVILHSVRQIKSHELCQWAENNDKTIQSHSFVKDQLVFLNRSGNVPAMCSNYQGLGVSIGSQVHKIKLVIIPSLLIGTKHKLLYELIYKLYINENKVIVKIFKMMLTSNAV